MVLNAFRARFSDLDFCRPMFGNKPSLFDRLTFNFFPMFFTNSFLESPRTDPVTAVLDTSLVSTAGLIAGFSFNGDILASPGFGCSLLLEDVDTRVITGFGRSPGVILTSVFTFTGGGGEKLALVSGVLASAVALIKAACNNDVFVIIPEFSVGGDDGSVAVANVIEDGGLSYVGEAKITELSSIYLRSAPSIPTRTSYDEPSPFTSLTVLVREDSEIDGGLSEAAGLHLNSDGGGIIL